MSIFKQLGLWPLLALVFLPAARCEKQVSVNQNLVDSAVVDLKWFAKDHRTVLLQSDRGRLYRSTNGGETWKDITTEMKGEGESQNPDIQVDSIIASPCDKNIVMVVGTQLEHYLSNDAGAKWTKIRIKSKIHTFIFHPKRPKWALLSTWSDACEPGTAKKKSTDDIDDPGPCQHSLYITKDLGRTFQLVVSYVVQFSWGDAAHNQEDRIYFTHFRKKSGDQPKLTLWSKNVNFAYTDDAGQRVTKVVERGNKFLVSNGFTFVAQLKEATAQTVKLMISSDGAQSFDAAKLPQTLEEKSYTILDTSEGAVMLHVNHGSRENGAVGNVYISDKEGVKFTLSLENNVRSGSGECEFDKMQGVDGVYMANFRDVQKSLETDEIKQEEEEEEEEDETGEDTQVNKRRSARAKGKQESVVRTVISFDKGGKWDRLQPPKVDSVGAKIDCPPDRCWLHLHGHTNFRNYAPFYSLENAIGLIMGTGNVGPYLRYEPDQVNTYMSRDGGLTWVEAHKGAFIYEFGDHGGLIVMADDIRKTKQVVFSWNEGQSWYDFDLSEGAVEVDNILTEPNSTASKFLLYGTRGTIGVLYYLDFEALGQPLCKGVWAADSVSSDYETWSPSDGRSKDRCILGHQVTYTRRKQASECFNGEQFERPVLKKNCECTEEDYECEIGFARKVGSWECKVAEPWLIPAPPTCTSSDFYYVFAHRKVVGDTCSDGWSPSKAAVPCPANSRMSNGAMSLLGTISTLAIIMMAVMYISSSERFKVWFANYGFENFTNVKYATIGTRAPETALDSVGTRVDTDFLEGDNDDYVDDAPQLMSYSSPSRSETIVRGGADAASEAVPKLTGPPGGAKAAPSISDDNADLL